MLPICYLFLMEFFYANDCLKNECDEFWWIKDNHMINFLLAKGTANNSMNFVLARRFIDNLNISKSAFIKLTSNEHIGSNGGKRQQYSLLFYLRDTQHTSKK